MNDDERLATLITGRLLDAARGVAWLSTGLTVAAAVLLLSAGFRVPLLGVLGLGVVATYLGFRVAFDARLFLDASERSLSAEAFDRAMTQLRLLAADKTGRSWSERCRAARGLLVAQAAAVMLQCALAAAAGWRR